MESQTQYLGKASLDSVLEKADSISNPNVRTVALSAIERMKSDYSPRGNYTEAYSGESS